MDPTPRGTCRTGTGAFIVGEDILTGSNGRQDPSAASYILVRSADRQDNVVAG